jgi:xanthine/CO dehydrogenase XdhC/CoxF family maturation factor
MAVDFTAEASLLLAEFGQPCVAGAVLFMAILDQPDRLIEFDRAAAHSREYELTYRSSAVTLARGQPVTIEGVAYLVREPPRQVDDGAFSRALLTRV